MAQRRSISDLLDVSESAWPTVQDWIRSAANRVEVLPASEPQNSQALIDTQVTTRSPMGAVIYHTGGLLVDQGWLRLLGSGHPRLRRSMPAWNQGRSTTSEGKPLGFWLVADDVIGGFFALNGGAFGPADGKAFYFAPDTLRWEPMAGIGYSEFLLWAFSSKLADFYDASRWENWQEETAALNGNQAFSFFPPLWTREGKDPSKCSRRPCPVSEIFGLNVVEYPRQLNSEAR